MRGFFRSHWKAIWAINLFLGVVLWIGFFTDLSLRGTWSDLLFPPIVGLLALASLGLARPRSRAARVFYAPSCVGASPYLLMGILLLVPPFTLAFLFGASEIADEVRIQEVDSPDQTRFKEVYFRPVGPYAGGSGKVYVRVISKYVPLIEQDIYAGQTHTAHEDTTDYVKWLDNNTLYIAETNTELDTSGVESELPVMAVIPAMAVEFLHEKITPDQRTYPLRDIPVFPGNLHDDSMSYLEDKQTAERMYFLPGSQINAVYSWYLASLSQSPWTVMDAAAVAYPDPGYEGQRVYCIIAQKGQPGQKTNYYFEIVEQWWTSADAQDVRVLVNTPVANSRYCWQK